MEVLALLCLCVAICEADEQLPGDLFSDHEGCMLRKKYRPLYHITAPNGWVKDPAGLAFYKGLYHVFYQYHPYTGMWGNMNWGHVVSKDLVTWTTYPPAIMAREPYEIHGCLAGTALVHNEYLTVIYTGIYEHSKTILENQNVALSTDGKSFKKYVNNPVIAQSPYARAGIQGFRNPKVWSFRTMWYMLVGAMSDRQQGNLLLYSSRNMINWYFNGTIAQSYGDMGYMWENPDYFEIGGEHVLIISARGVQPQGIRFRNLAQSGYVLGDLNYHTGKFNDPFELSTATFNELDFGHDFYGPKTMRSTDGRQLLIAWLGMEESTCEETVGGWASMLTIFRELRLKKDGRLLMQPIREMTELRTERLEDAWYKPGEEFNTGTRSFELLVNSTEGSNEVGLIFELGGDLVYLVWYSSTHGSVTVDRGGMDGERRASWAPTRDIVFWRIFFDKSSVEVFCGNGEVVFTSRVYPKSNDKGIRIKIGGDSRVHISLYKLKRSIQVAAPKLRYSDTDYSGSN